MPRIIARKHKAAAKRAQTAKEIGASLAAIDRKTKQAAAKLAKLRKVAI